MSLLCELYQLLRSWWQVDRIRISPTEGEWLRLDPPCLVFVEGRPVEVLRKSFVSVGTKRIVEYECLRDGGTARAIVTAIDERGSVTVVWQEAETTA